jgi:hypothetical protein
MKLKIFLLLFLIFDFSNCLGMEKLMTNIQQLCNLPLQVQYAQASAVYQLRKNKDESFFESAVLNNYSLVVKDMLSKYDELQETAEQAIKKIRERAKLCIPLFGKLVCDQNCSESAQLVADALKKDMRILEEIQFLVNYTGIQFQTFEASTYMQKIFTWAVQKGQLKSVQMLLDSGLVKIDEHELFSSGISGLSLCRIALKRKYPEIAHCIFKKGLDESVNNISESFSVIPLKNGESILYTPKGPYEGDFKKETLTNFITAALQTKHYDLASDWIAQMVQKNKWHPNKFCNEFFTNTNQGTQLLINYGISCNEPPSINLHEEDITGQNLKDTIFLLKFTKKIKTPVILKKVIDNGSFLAIEWVFNPGRFISCKDGGFSYTSFYHPIQIHSEDKLNQFVIDNAEKIGLPDLKTVDDVKKHQALWLKFKAGKLDAIRNKAIESNKYPIDWEGEFEKFKEVLDRQVLTAATNANRIVNFIKDNPKNVHINYLISLKRDKPLQQPNPNDKNDQLITEID